MSQPRVLFITGHLPYPPISGGRRREFELLRRLGGFDVTLCAVSKTFKEDLANARALSSLCDVRVFPADPLTAEEGLPRQVLLHRCKGLRSLITSLEPDLIHVEGFYLFQHAAGTGVPVLLVEQNIEWTLWQQRAATGSPSALAEVERTRQAEIRAWREATRCAAVSEDDRLVMQRHLHQSVGLVPDGIERPARRQVAPRTNEIVFVGNFAYQPNVDAANYLVNEIFPLVASAAPEARVVLVGNDPPAEVRALAGPKVSVTGRVPEVTPYIERAAVVVCPLRVGGGVKVKMLEALALGKAIVTTRIGLQGLDEVSQAVLCADEPHAFAAGVTALLTDEGRRQAHAARALDAAERLPSWDDAATALAEEYAALVEVGLADTGA